MRSVKSLFAMMRMLTPLGISDIDDPILAVLTIQKLALCIDRMQAAVGAGYRRPTAQAANGWLGASGQFDHFVLPFLGVNRSIPRAGWACLNR